MTDLSDNEKARVIQVALEHILPIAVRYELDQTIGITALTEAFQAGIQFAVKEMKEVGYGGSQSGNHDAVGQ